jgi:hypothetical protein
MCRISRLILRHIVYKVNSYESIVDSNVSTDLGIVDNNESNYYHIYNIPQYLYT